ncbi:MAG: cobalamin-independent methionine synthase II family protein [Trueperaceae bacterium]|nr:MAG: cobalamin-independent methionine synthase II family protein [Trueperaceae bacterium]
MNTSDQRILTTHVGSMPRPQEVVDMLFAEDKGDLTDREAYQGVMKRAVAETVSKQVAAGVDVVSDGEMSKISYATYIRHRLSGFEIGEVPRATPKDLDEFPAFRDRLAQAGGTPKYHRPICNGPIHMVNKEPLERDIANLKAALEQSGATEGFMNAASPGVIAVFQPNTYYDSHEAYLQALAEAMKEEYEAIAAAGLLLQIDCPDLAMGRHIKFRDIDDGEFLHNAELQIEALNYALSDIPADRVRMHVCWGNYEGPHTHDIPFSKIFDTVMKAKPQAVLFEAANPRHAHEWTVWRDHEVPPDKILVPGVLDTTTNFVEHPELVAERIERFGRMVGPERVIAGTDCGFGTFAGFGAVHPDICWAKLESLARGAEIASERLFA